MKSTLTEVQRRAQIAGREPHLPPPIDAGHFDRRPGLFEQTTGEALEAPLAPIRDDHAEHGEMLRRPENLAGGLALPDGACRSRQTLHAGAAKLRDDLIEHIHVEKNVRIPGFQDEQPA